MDAKTAMEKCPAKVWVGTSEFAIEFVPPDNEHLRPSEEDPNGNDGIALFDPNRILIANTLPLSKLADIVHHELTHALNWEEDIEDGEDEEVITQKHGRAWSQFFIINPRYGRWWLSLCVAIRKERHGATKRKGKQ